ncbi:MAG: hypothetical protein CVV30_00410 [Methanomicrobiales archaeon HGW-Methanomicrobiales-1]|jgi:hypothetical protein|nr:MAG: hypothetical protein CVV30_00410 [Methanomicrobiales archaeon HGW-Methanomicrobiales-1]
MLAKFLQWIMTKKPRPGYVKARARCVAGFLVTMMVVVTSLMGMLRVVQNRKWDRNSGCSTGNFGPALAGHNYVSFGIHRQAPVF